MNRKSKCVNLVGLDEKSIEYKVEVKIQKEKVLKGERMKKQVDKC